MVCKQSLKNKKLILDININCRRPLEKCEETLNKHKTSINNSLK